MSEPKPQTVDSVTSATPGSDPRWIPGDTGLTKEATPGTHIYVGAEEAARLGLRDGVDGWDEFTVVPDEPAASTITEFLLARIAEDEDQAEACRKLGWGIAEKYGITAISFARVLAECAAKRAIIDHFDGDPGGAAVLRVMAAVYREHPDYEEALNGG